MLTSKVFVILINEIVVEGFQRFSIFNHAKGKVQNSQQKKKGNLNLT